MIKKDKKTGKFIKTRFDRFCLDCGKQLSGYKSKRCSVCAVKKRIKKYPMQSGKNAIRYIDGRRSYRKIIKPDKCKICGGNKSLCVHHLDKDRKNNNKKNLIVVCSSCHHKYYHVNEHKKFYGNQYTTKNRVA